MDQWSFLNQMYGNDKSLEKVFTIRLEFESSFLSFFHNLKKSRKNIFNGVKCPLQTSGTFACHVSKPVASVQLHKK